MILNQKKIFIVEDDLINRAIIQLLLEKHGAKTAIERWGVDTLKRIHAFMPVDIILLDLMLPHNVSGFDIFDQIKADPNLSHIPVVAVSAMDPAIAIPEAQRRGMNGFIPKPVDYGWFPKQIASILEQESLWLTGIENQL